MRATAWCSASRRDPTRSLRTAGECRDGRQARCHLTLAINSYWGLIALVLLLPLMHYGVVLREERYLERKFGESYLHYKARVRRYLQEPGGTGEPGVDAG